MTARTGTDPVLAGHPPAPWMLRGEAAILVAPVRMAAARAYGLPAGVELVGAGGWTLGGALLARYDETATLEYHELIVFSGLARRGSAAAMIVSHIYVDSAQSLSGGHAIWGLPKELAEFEWDWQSGSLAVTQGERPLLRASLRRRQGLRIPLPLLSPVFGTVGGATVRAAGRGTLPAAPVLARLDVPEESPFAALGLGGTRLGVAGSGLDLRFPAARPAL